MKRKLFLAIVALTFISVLIIPNSVSTWVWKTSFGQSIKIFVQRQTNAISEEFRIIKDLHSLGSKVNSLQKEVMKLKVELAMNESIKKENEELSRLLKIKDTYAGYTIIPAKILSFSLTDPNRITVYFDKSDKNRISRDSTVVSSMGLVGKIISFMENSADVELITSTSFSLPVVLESQNECTGIAKGNGQSMTIKFIDRNCASYSLESKKFLSANFSKNSTIPYIPVGAVKISEEDPENVLFLKAEAEPLFKKGKLNHLFIISGEGFTNEKVSF